MRNTVLIREVDVTPVLHAIERARLRLLLKSSTTPIAQAAAAESASLRDRESAETPTHSPDPTVLN